MKKVSILIPVYGVEKFIAKCVCSLFEQTYENIEYIFVDDCSPDKSIQVLKEVLQLYPNRQFQVKIVRHSVNKGLAAARNTALEYATGDYVLNMDSDDYLDLEAIGLLSKMADLKNADVVVFDSYLEYSGKQRKMYEPFVPNKTTYIKLLLQLDVSPSICRCFLKRDLYFHSAIRAIEGVNQGEDLSVTPRLLYGANTIVKLDKYLYHYVQYNNASYTNNLTEKSFNNMIQVCNTLYDFFSNVNDAELYTNSLMILKLRVKIYLLKNMTYKYLPDVSSLFLNIEDEYKYLLLPQERIALFFSRHKWYMILHIYIYLGVLFKKYYNTIFKK